MLFYRQDIHSFVMSTQRTSDNLLFDTETYFNIETSQYKISLYPSIYIYIYIQFSSFLPMFY